MFTARSGERIGTLRLDSPREGKNDPQGARFAEARALQDLVIQAVYEGANLQRVNVAETGDDYEPQIALYAHPAVKDSEEARRLGLAIEELLERARVEYPGRELDPREMDTFIPPSSPEHSQKG
jgi:hypothetical protein